MFVISLRLNNYLRQKIMHETIPDNKISKISKVDKLEEPTVLKKSNKQPPVVSDLPSMIDLDIEKGAIESS